MLFRSDLCLVQALTPHPALEFPNHLSETYPIIHLAQSGEKSLKKTNAPSVGMSSQLKGPTAMKLHAKSTLTIVSAPSLLPLPLLSP